jgi:XTP/dITP diphosphohydrolase
MAAVPTLLFATTNPNKVKELRAVLAPLGYVVESLEVLREVPPEPEEDADTFAGNARLKAVAYARATGLPCLAEDSGLEVDALGGAPGVHSARYSGSAGSREEKDRANNEKLLRELGDVPPERRAARFVCAMCLCAADGTVLVETSGTYEGVIAEAEAGTNGFGYDPLLYLPDVGRTSAELSPQEKSARSHRGKAARLLARHLEADSVRLKALLAEGVAAAKVPAS